MKSLFLLLLCLLVTSCSPDGKVGAVATSPAPEPKYHYTVTAYVAGRRVHIESDEYIHLSDQKSGFPYIVVYDKKNNIEYTLINTPILYTKTLVE